MTHSVLVGPGGYAGWNYLKRTEAAQKVSIQKEPQIQKARDAFLSDLSGIKDAESLLADYKLLNVALTAFGLDGDIKNKAFIKKILESDLSDEKSFANRLSDKRYLDLAKALQLGPDTGELTPASAEEIFDKFIDHTFEARIGEQDPLLRQALYAKRELPKLVSSGGSAETFWYKVLGSAPLRDVFDGAFALPKSFGKLPIDRQLTEYMSRAEKMFGDASPKSLSEPEHVEKLISSYLLRSQINVLEPSSPYSTALTILTAR